jgi:BolA protein
METPEIIERNLKEKLSAGHIEIIDESHLHRGHKAAGGGGHYSIVVVSPQFENVNVMDRVRLVHKALDHEMTGTPKLIHALQVKTYDSAQWNEKG